MSPPLPPLLEHVDMFLMCKKSHRVHSTVHGCELETAGGSIGPLLSYALSCMILSLAMHCFQLPLLPPLPFLKDNRPLKNKSRLQGSGSLSQMSMGNNMGFFNYRT